MEKHCLMTPANIIPFNNNGVSPFNIAVGNNKLMPNIAPMIPINGAPSLQQQQHFMLGQPQFTTAPAAQPQFFIAGPSQSNGTGLPYQQILIPINQPSQVQPTNMAAPPPQGMKLIHSSHSFH